MGVRVRRARLITLLSAVLADACGGASNPVAPPASPPAPSLTATVNVTATGFKPTSVEIGVGGRVTFVNIDDRPHSVASNPIETHLDCPAINDAGFLTPGQSRDTGVFTIARTCGYHDSTTELTERLGGTIVIR